MRKFVESLFRGEATAQQGDSPLKESSAQPTPERPERREASERRDASEPGPKPPWRTEGLPKGGKQAAPSGLNWRKILLWLVLPYVVLFVFFTLQDRASVVTVTYTEFSAQVDAKNVEAVFSRGDSIEGKLRAGAPIPDAPEGATEVPTYTDFQTERPTFADDNLFARLEAGDVIVSATPVVEQRGFLTNLLVSVLPLVVIFGLYWWLMRKQTGALGGLFGKKREPVNPETVRVTFADVAGIDEVEGEISEIVDFLRNPDRYRRLGARAPKGVLLTGPPGTGKTLLARATAGEAKVPFFSASGSEFIEMIVGVGAQRVRELFSEARKVAPAIIFIDEIDTIGRTRAGAMSIGGHDEGGQTLNQVLTEMDGFSGDEGVVVMAATNRPDVLDPALLRPGRFDRQVTVNAPDQAGRKAILEIHTRKIPLADDVDLGRVASTTPGMTGADLANLANEAALLAAKRNRQHVTPADFSDALEKVQLGPARAVVMPPEERRRTAYHEGGHALLGILQPGADRVRKVSIVPRGRSLGATYAVPERDRYGYDEKYLRGRVIGALGGMAAEDIILGMTSSGAENDLEQATRVVRAMVGRWGMSDRIGPVSVLPSEGDPRMTGISDEMLSAVDREVHQVIDECYGEAKRQLSAHRTQLEAIANALLEHETLDEDQVYALAGGAMPAEQQAVATAAARRSNAASQRGG